MVLSYLVSGQMSFLSDELGPVAHGTGGPFACRRLSEGSSDLEAKSSDGNSPFIKVIKVVQQELNSRASTALAACRDITVYENPSHMSRPVMSREKCTL